MKLLKIIQTVYRNVAHWREAWLFPLAGIVALLLGIHFVQFLTGRAVVDDPGSIISMLYNGIGVLIAVAILGGMKGHLIPDYDEQQASADWRMALIDVVGTVLVFFTLCHFIFK